MTCPLCLNILEDAVMIRDCNHRFCNECLIQAMNRSACFCPMCRGVFKISYLARLNIMINIKWFESSLFGTHLYKLAYFYFKSLFTAVVYKKFILKSHLFVKIGSNWLNSLERTSNGTKWAPIMLSEIWLINLNFRASLMDVRVKFRLVL